MKLESNLTLRPDFLYLAPLVNVVLLLLLFFILNSSLVVRSGYRVELPESRSSLKPVERAHHVTILPGPETTLYFNNRQVYPGDLRSLLEEARQESRYVILNADRTVPYGIVMRVIGEVKAAGLELATGTSMAEQPPIPP